MSGVIYYSLFLVMGVLYADMIFKNKSIYFKIWSGGIIGSIALMFGIIPLAALLGFTKSAHVCLGIIYTSVYFFMRKTPGLRLEKPNTGAAVSTAAVTAVICVLCFNHIMMPTEGGIAAGQSTYGDLAMHMGFVTSIAEQKTFPPCYNLLSGTRLCYPFLFDSLSSSLYLFGTNLRTAILYPSFVFAFLTVSGFYFLAKKLLKNKNSAVLAVILFFLGGGFGFAYFFEGAKANGFNFLRMFTEYYHTPTNYNELNIRWVNAICDMLVPQRTTMAGWCVLFLALWLLCDCLEEKRTSRYVLLGVIAGSMPMIHTHSFLALGIMSAVCFFMFLPGCGDRRSYIKNWCIYGAIAIGMSAGQLMFWTFRQSVGNGQFLRLSAGWVNKNDPPAWFWLKNWGLIAVFIIPAFMSADGFVKKFCVGGAVIFVLANIIIFQPNEYDNNKLLFVSYMLAVILVSGYWTEIYTRLRNICGTRLLAAIVIFVSVLSGTLSIAREYISGGEYKTFSDSDIEFADFVKNNTDPHAVFASGNGHLNPVCVLAGRSIYAGSELYVYYHGFEGEMYKRYGELKELYEGGSPEETARKYNIDYVMVGESEREQYYISPEAFAGLDRIYYKDGIELYRIKY